MTALEWLEEELKGVYESDYFNKLLEQSKEMEKEQIIDACEFGKAFGLNQAWGYYNPIVNPEQYYNKTFKSE